ncbi:MAG: PHP domain-containing protein [Agarilytica sp.]
MSERIYDLHCHSDQSDGILSPEALVSRAKSNDVTVLALTDHDTTKGLARAAAQAKKEGLTLIEGIEFSCQWLGRGIHIVGLNIDSSAPDLCDAVEKQENLRQERAEIIAQKLEKLGVENALEGARQQAGVGGVIGRPHFAQYLVESGYCKSVAHSFKKYLGAGKPGDVKQVWPEFEPMVAAIRSAGGIAVLAHPNKYKLTRTKLRAMLEDFKEIGGEGIEVVSGKQELNATRDMAMLAQQFDLLASCGSDFHVPNAPWQELGKFSRLPDNLAPVWSHWE